MRKIFYLLILGTLVSPTVFGQLANDSLRYEPYNHNISISPFYFMIGDGVRFDYERKLHRDGHWIDFAPQYYKANPEKTIYDAKEGFGLNVHYKIFFNYNKDKNPDGMSKSRTYFSFGPMYQFYSIPMIQEIPQEIIIDGIPYFEFNEVDLNIHQQRFGFDTYFGVVQSMGQFIIDFYIGVGYRKSWNGDDIEILPRNPDPFDINYTGLIITAGIKLGVQW